MNSLKSFTWAVVAGVVGVTLSPTASAQRQERSGVEVVQTVCAACHAKGENGAPRIGDKTAWATRAAQGLTALTEHALKGIRNMPAHGGSATLSNIEVERAITTMVNRSGGRWVEPLGGATPAVVRSSEQIVQTQCFKCHQEGLGGAPKIGDRAAWIPRLGKGLDTLVKSAVHGRGHMPARGGAPDLSDRELEGAIVYMFNYGIAVPQSTPPASAAIADPYHKRIDGADVYFGIVPADVMAARQRQANAPSGKGYYHVNISLFDAQTQRAISDAQVKVKVADAIGADSKTLELISTNNTISYGGYFRMSGPSVYAITAQIQRPGVAGVAEAKFQYKAR